MTVTYTAEVATVRGMGIFWKLLFRWRGSIYKLLWPDLILYMFLYVLLSVIYRFALDERQKQFFEQISQYCHQYSDLIPVAFVLGFYVSIVIKRWWDQYMGIPWPDALAMFVSTCIHGQDERGRLMRRTIMRYVNLSFVLTLSMMSSQLKKRFPTLDHLVEAGLMLPNEKKIFDDLNEKTTHPKYWMPLVWAGSIVTRARKEGRVRDDYAMNTLIQQLATFRGLCGGMLNYDWISIPLVYTQVVTLAVYIFFLASLMGRQYLDPSKKIPGYEVDLFFPVFPFLQFFFYMGWLKVAESLVNPFGEDDDDFEMNWLVDRNLQVSYLIVDEMHQEHPELIKDQYWDECFPTELPYTAAAEMFRSEPPQGSAADIEVPEEEAEFVPLETILEGHEGHADLPEELRGVQVEVSTSSPHAGTHPMRIMNRQSSNSSRSSLASSMRNRPMSTRQSMLSVLQRFFHRDRGGSRDLGSQLGSMQSIQSHMRRQHSSAYMRSMSRVSTSPTTQSPVSIPRVATADFQDSLSIGGQKRSPFPDRWSQQDDIFKMSDLSLNSSSHQTSLTSSTQQVAMPDRRGSHPMTHYRDSGRDLSATKPLISPETSSDVSRRGSAETDERGTDLEKDSEIDEADTLKGEEGTDTLSRSDSKTKLLKRMRQTGKGKKKKGKMGQALIASMGDSNSPPEADNSECIDQTDTNSITSECSVKTSIFQQGSQDDVFEAALGELSFKENSEDKIDQINNIPLSATPPVLIPQRTDAGILASSGGGPRVSFAVTQPVVSALQSLSPSPPNGNRCLDSVGQTFDQHSIASTPSTVVDMSTSIASQADITVGSVPRSEPIPTPPSLNGHGDVPDEANATSPENGHSFSPHLVKSIELIETSSAPSDIYHSAFAPLHSTLFTGLEPIKESAENLLDSSSSSSVGSSRPNLSLSRGQLSSCPSCGTQNLSAGSSIASLGSTTSSSPISSAKQLDCNNYVQPKLNGTDGAVDSIEEEKNNEVPK